MKIFYFILLLILIIGFNRYEKFKDCQKCKLYLDCKVNQRMQRKCIWKKIEYS
jgi:hypothetical protein